MTTVDGGALAIKNATDEEMEKARRLRWFGLDKNTSRLENDIKYAGYKYAMNNVNAVIGKVQMQSFDGVLSRHISNGRYYDEELKGIPGVKLVPYYKDTEAAYWLYTIKVDNREEFIRMMTDAGITASQLHHRSDTHSVFAESKCELPGLDEFYDNFVHIPCGWWVDDAERGRIADCIKKGW